MIDVVYFILISREIAKKRTFKSLGVKLKVMFQEVAILTFLVVLTAFAIFKSQQFRESKFYSLLEWVVIVGIGVAIGAELISVFWTIYGAIKSFKENFKNKKLLKKMTELEKETRVTNKDDDSGPRKIETLNKPLQKFATRTGTGKLSKQDNSGANHSNEDQIHSLPWKKAATRHAVNENP